MIIYPPDHVNNPNNSFKPWTGEIEEVKFNLLTEITSSDHIDDKTPIPKSEYYSVGSNEGISTSISRVPYFLIEEIRTIVYTGKGGNLFNRGLIASAVYGSNLYYNSVQWDNLLNEHDRFQRSCQMGLISADDKEDILTLFRNGIKFSSSDRGTGYCSRLRFRWTEQIRSRVIKFNTVFNNGRLTSLFMQRFIMEALRVQYCCQPEYKETMDSLVEKDLYERTGKFTNSLKNTLNGILGTEK